MDSLYPSLEDGILRYWLYFSPLLDYVRLERDYFRLKKMCLVFMMESSRNYEPLFTSLTMIMIEWVLMNKSSQQRTSPTW